MNHSSSQEISRRLWNMVGYSGETSKFSSLVRFSQNGYPSLQTLWSPHLNKLQPSQAQLPPPKKTIELDGDFSDAEHFLDKCTKVLTAADGFPLLGISGDPCVEDFWQRF